MKSLQQFLESHQFLVKGHTKEQTTDICGIKIKPLTNIKNKSDFDNFIKQFDGYGEFEHYKSDGYIYTALENDWSTNATLSKENVDILEKFIKEFCSNKEQFHGQPFVNYYFTVKYMLEKCNNDYSILAGLINKIWIDIFKM